MHPWQILVDKVTNDRITAGLATTSPQVQKILKKLSKLFYKLIS